MKKRILATICALACACTMSSPVYAKDLASETDLSTQQLDRSTVQTLSEKGSYNITVRSDMSKVSPADFTTITGTLNASNTIDTCTINVPERAALVMYSSALYPSAGVRIELQSQSGTLVCSQYLSSSTLENSEDMDDGILLEPGTYTLTYSVSGTVKDNITYTTNLAAYAASTEQNVEIGSGYIGFQKGGEDVYKKVTVKKSGLLAVCSYVYGSGFGEYLMTQKDDKLYICGQSLALCNGNKKAITEQETTLKDNYYINYYAVKAGTYYVKMKYASDNYYALGIDFKVGGTTNNTSRSKALKLSSKYKSTLMPIGGSSKTRWYKVTLKKKKKFTIYYDFYGQDGAVQVSVCNKNGKKMTLDTTIYSGRSGKLSTSRKYSKGTYYIKVSKPLTNSYSMEGLLDLKVK